MADQRIWHPVVSAFPNQFNGFRIVLRPCCAPKMPNGDAPRTLGTPNPGRPRISRKWSGAGGRWSICGVQILNDRLVCGEAGGWHYWRTKVVES
jgi:hypothetical protein